ncbi:uncharacterized protein LOC117639610 [Thrips palmi]|uniref:Uncharacterized protein LOC117639610 n=1 Tax=Thrips palmi TaxID=161013 RepID=A0A6P8Y4I7_THRPL|nr:uncharacterized protein LOC117639610 [Thrips palmi]
MVCLFYGIILFMYGKEGLDDTAPAYAIMAFCNGSGAYAMARMCHLTSREAGRTHRLVHAVLNNQYLTTVEERRLRDFSFQLVHSDAAVRPFGMFCVNYGLLSSARCGYVAIGATKKIIYSKVNCFVLVGFQMVMSVFTYLVILGQFDLISLAVANDHRNVTGTSTAMPDDAALAPF